MNGLLVIIDNTGLDENVWMLVCRSGTLQGSESGAAVKVLALQPS